jgi:hypothetical protein
LLHPRSWSLAVAWRSEVLTSEETAGLLLR